MRVLLIALLAAISYAQTDLTCFSWEERPFTSDIPLGLAFHQDFETGERLPWSRDTEWHYGAPLGWFTRGASLEKCRELCNLVEECVTIVHFETFCFLYERKDIPMDLEHAQHSPIESLTVEDKTILKCDDQGRICKADYGTQVGDVVCCGNDEVLLNSARVCPSIYPICHGYKAGKTWGSCIAAPDIWKSSYIPHLYTHYWGANIGECGSYATQEEIEEACSKNSECIGYSMADPHQFGSAHQIHPDAVAHERSRYPWCIQSRSPDDASPSLDGNTDFYRKPEDILCIASGPPVDFSISNCTDLTEESECVAFCKYGVQTSATFVCTLGVWVGDLFCEDSSIAPQFRMTVQEHNCTNSKGLPYGVYLDVLQCSYLVSQDPTCDVEFYFDHDSLYCACVPLGEECNIRHQDEDTHVYKIVERCWIWEDRIEKSIRGAALKSHFDNGEDLPPSVDWHFFAAAPSIGENEISQYSALGWFTPNSPGEVCRDLCGQIDTCVTIVHMGDVCFVYPERAIPFDIMQKDLTPVKFTVEDRVFIPCINTENPLYENFLQAFVLGQLGAQECPVNSVPEHDPDQCALVAEQFGEPYYSIRNDRDAGEEGSEALCNLCTNCNIRYFRVTKNWNEGTRWACRNLVKQAAFG